MIPIHELPYYEPPTTSLDISLWALVSIEHQPIWFPIKSVECVHTFNYGEQNTNLPGCRIAAPVGIEPATGTFSMHELLRRLVFQVPIEVYLRVGASSGNVSGALALSPGYYLLFRGLVISVNYERGPTQSELVISAVHWLYALNFSSALSETSHPANPTDLIFNPFVRTGAGSRGGLTNIDDFQATIGPLNVMSDLWGHAIFPWFVNLALVDRIGSVAFWPFTRNDSVNFMALWALSKFVNGVWPLALRVDYPESFYYILQIANALAGLESGQFDVSLHALANKTLWQELMRLSDAFLFGVVALPTAAVVVPFIPANQNVYLPYGDLDVTVLARDVLHIQLISGDIGAGEGLHQPLRAVGLFGSIGTFAGSGLRETDTTLGLESRIGGMFVSPFLGHGMVRFMPAPFYAATIVNPSVWGPTALMNFRRTSGRTIAPITPIVYPAIETLRSLTSSLLDNLAQYLYVKYNLFGRAARLVCPLRFDIAPGSTIVIEGAGNAVFPGFNFLHDSRIFGLVEAVTHTISISERGTVAHTSYDLRYIRNGFEQASPAFATMLHPLYRWNFAGMPMLNGPQNGWPFLL